MFPVLSFYQERMTQTFAQRLTHLEKSGVWSPDASSNAFVPNCIVMIICVALFITDVMVYRIIFEKYKRLT